MAACSGVCGLYCTSCHSNRLLRWLHQSFSKPKAITLEYHMVTVPLQVRCSAWVQICTLWISRITVDQIAFVFKPLRFGLIPKEWPQPPRCVNLYGPAASPGFPASFVISWSFRGWKEAGLAFCCWICQLCSRTLFFLKKMPVLGFISVILLPLFCLHRGARFSLIN